MVTVLDFHKGYKRNGEFIAATFINNLLGSNFSRTDCKVRKTRKAVSFRITQPAHWKFVDIWPDQFISLMILFILSSYRKSENHPMAGNVKAREMNSKKVTLLIVIMSPLEANISINDLSAATHPKILRFPVTCELLLSKHLTNV